MSGPKAYNNCDIPPRPFVQRCFNSCEKTNRNERNRIYIKGNFSNLLENHQRKSEKENASNNNYLNLNSNRTLATFRPDPDKILADNTAASVNTGTNPLREAYSKDTYSPNNDKGRVVFTRETIEAEREKDLESMFKPVDSSSKENIYANKSELKAPRANSPKKEENGFYTYTDETTTSSKRVRAVRLTPIEGRSPNQKRSASVIFNPSCGVSSTNRSFAHSIYQSTLEDDLSSVRTSMVDNSKRAISNQIKALEQKLRSLKEIEDKMIRRDLSPCDEGRWALAKNSFLERRCLEMRNMLNDVCCSNRPSRGSRGTLFF
jgi:hypothetical protein